MNLKEPTMFSDTKSDQKQQIGNPYDTSREIKSNSYHTESTPFEKEFTSK